MGEKQALTLVFTMPKGLWSDSQEFLRTRKKAVDVTEKISFSQ